MFCPEHLVVLAYPDWKMAVKYIYLFSVDSVLLWKMAVKYIYLFSVDSVLLWTEESYTYLLLVFFSRYSISRSTKSLTCKLYSLEPVVLWLYFIVPLSKLFSWTWLWQPSYSGITDKEMSLFFPWWQNNYISHSWRTGSSVNKV